MEKNKEFRCHPAIIFSKAIKPIIGLLFVFATDFEGAALDENGNLQMPVIYIAIGILVALTLWLLIWGYLAWKRTFIALTDENFIYDKRTLIFKKKVNLRLSQISTVNLRKTLLDRLCGTYTVKLDINSSITAEKTDFHLVFKEDFAKGFAEYISNRKNGLEEEPQPLEPVEEIAPYTFTVKDIILHALLGVPVSSLIFLGALFSGVAIPLFQFESYLMAIAPLIGFPAAALLSFSSGIIKSVFHYHNFTVSKKGDSLTLSSGLITRNTYNLPLKKTNAVIVRQTFMGRILGFYFAEIINIGMGDMEEEGAPTLCLMMKKDKLAEFLERFVPDFCGKFQFEKSPKKAILPIFVKGFLIAFCLGAAVTPALILTKAPTFLITAVYLVLAVFLVLCTFFSYISKGIYIGDKKVSIATGVFAKRIITLPFNKIQSVAIKTGPVSGRLKIAKGWVNILSPVKDRRNLIGYFTPEIFKQITEKTEKVW